MRRLLPLALAAAALAACDGDPVGTDTTNPPDTLTADTTRPPSPIAIPVLGHGAITDRYTAEVAVSGATAYTTTWSFRRAPGNAVYIWDVSGAAPVLVDSVLVDGATTLGDVQISPDGGLLVVPTEQVGSLAVFDRSDARAPALLTRYSSANVDNGVHTAKLGVVNGILYAFLQVNRGHEEPAQLVILDLSEPAQPVEVLVQPMGDPFVHDVFVRDGLLFAALWHDGMSIFDIGGGGRGGSPSAPVLLSNIQGDGLRNIHNIWWLHDQGTGSKRYAILGEEVPVPGFSSQGDIHVVDISDLSAPRYVARYGVEGSGTHNFSVDEDSGILYAAYYNAGVRALDVRGDLGACLPAERTAEGLCDLRLMGREVGTALADGAHYVWGVVFQGPRVYASDMLSGIYALDGSQLAR